MCDLDLLAAWQAGDQGAGEKLFSRHFDRLLRFFWNKVPRGAEDLVQETLMACHIGRDRIVVPFDVYLFAIARRRLLAHWDKERRRSERIAPLETSVAELGGEAPNVLAEREEVRLLLRALRQIPLDHQILLELFYWEGLTGPSLATVLKIPEGTVRTRLRRARALLSAQIEAIADSPELSRTTSSNLEQWARHVASLIPRKT